MEYLLFKALETLGWFIFLNIVFWSIYGYFRGREERAKEQMK